MPRYEKKDSKGITFWAFHVFDDGSLLLREGKAGTNGREETKHYATQARALTEAERLALARVKKGYALVKTLPRARSVAAVQGLEEAIARSPDDLEPFVVYADWLQERGDALGELITLAIALDDAKTSGDDAKAEELDATITAWRKANDKSVFGPVATHLKRLQLTWRRGLIESVRVRSGPAERNVPQGDLVGALLSLPVGRFVTKLSFPSLAYTDCALAFADVRPRALRELVIEPGYSGAPFFMKHLNVLDGLRVLDVRSGEATFADLVLPNLETLRLAEVVPDFVDVSLPNLDRVELKGWFRGGVEPLAPFEKLSTVVIRGALDPLSVITHVANELPKVKTVEVEKDVADLRIRYQAARLRGDLEIKPVAARLD